MSKPSMREAFIAERILICVENPSLKVLVKLAKPKRNPKGKDFESTYQITGKALNITRSIAGVDAFQALQLALLMIGADIGRIERESGIRLRFSGGEDAGFSDHGSA
jgi:uncharacterized protein DUF6968